VNQIEAIRSQLYKLTSAPPAVAGGPNVGNGTVGQSASSANMRSVPSAVADGSQLSPAIVKAANELDKRLIAVEENLIQRRLTGQGQDTVRWPPKLISKLNYLASGIAGADFAPTNQHREVKTMFEEQLNAFRARLDHLLKDDLEDLNKLLREKSLPAIKATL